MDRSQRLVLLCILQIPFEQYAGRELEPGVKKVTGK